MHISNLDVECNHEKQKEGKNTKDKFNLLLYNSNMNLQEWMCVST